MSDQVTQDETSGFEVTISDLPEATPAQEETTDEQASSEVVDTEEGKQEDDANQQDEKPNDEKAEDSTDDKSGDNATAAKPKQKGFQKRIDKLTRQREDEKRKSEALERELDGYRKKPEQQAVKEPVESDFESYDEYLDALDSYDEQTVDVKKPVSDGKQEEDSKDKTEESPLTDSQLTAQAVLTEKLEGAELPDNFKEVALNPDVAITGDMMEALAECDDPGKVLFHLGNNKDLASDIAGQTPVQQMRAIARLDLSADIKPEKPVKTTNASEPISPVNGSDAQQKPVSEMSFKEHEEYMNKRERSQKSSW